jgi:DNA-binding IclR family transcriptional regulator
MKLLSSVKNALKVLETFSADRPELSLTEISKLLESHKSSTFRILMTLASEGFVEKNPSNNKYRLGLRILELANRVMGRDDLRDVAGPELENLARKTGEIIHLSILDRNEIVYLEKKGEGQFLTVATKIGGRSPAHASAMGKVLLSGLSGQELSGVLAPGPLARFTPNTITEMPVLISELEKVRNQGFAIDDEEAFPGIRCVAAPIRGRGGRIVAAISATVPRQRMAHQRMNEIRKEMTETARMISERIEMTGLGE